MKNYLLFFFYALIALATTFSLFFQAHAAPAGPLIKHLSSLIKWTRSTTSKFPHSASGGNFLQFENGYVVETVVEGNTIGVIPYRIRVSEEDGELFAVDAINSNIVRITPPLSQYSRGRLVAGSFQGYTGHVDGKPSDARFNHPKGITMDDKGNVYVADTQNMAIRKIGDAGVTTIAGGKSSAGYRDGPSEDAKFSNDFDLIYIRPTCSLLVIDRGNAALRQISLDQEDCDYQSSSISSTEILTVVGAVIVGYATCMLQQGLGSSFFSKTQSSETEFKGQASNEKPIRIHESSKEEPGWPSFGQLIVDLSKIFVEALASAFIQLIPSRFRSDGPKRGLTPLKDHLRMPEDEVVSPKRGLTPLKDRLQMPEDEVDGPKRGLTQLKERLRMPEDEVDGPKRGLTRLKDRLRMPEDEVQPPLANGQSAHAPLLTENRQQIHTPSTAEKYTELKPPKLKSSSFNNRSLSSKQRSSKRPEYGEFYGSTESPPYSKSKSQKERPKHRSREKSGEAVFGAAGAEAKPFDTRAVDYNNPKFDHYSMRTKYVSGESFRFNSQ